MKKLRISLFASLLFIACAFTFFSGDREIIRNNSEVLSAFFNTLDQYYVDTIDADKTLKTAINSTLSALDPYSYFIAEKDQEQSKKNWKGILFGGLGFSIIMRDSDIVVSDVQIGFPAAANDIRCGDILTEAEGIPLHGLSTDSCVKMVRGEPGTEVSIKIRRGKELIVHKKIKREQIVNRSVTCSTILENHIGYIRFMHFLDGSAADLKSAFLKLKEAGATSLVLDIRDNTGGLVVEAVAVSNIFLPKGLNVVSFRGRAKEWNYDNPTLGDPVDTLMPLVIVTDKYSISAAELFAGAMQDYDRGVVLGQKTFGKGFVQGTRPLPFGNSVYMTSARYHTPSGRCIQELDYTKRDADGKPVHMDDSLRKYFKTRAGRTVYDIGGIVPDVKTHEIATHSFVDALTSSFLIFDFANSYRNTHATIPDAAQFRLSNQDFEDFYSFVSRRNFSFQTKEELQLLAFETKSKEEKHFDEISESYYGLLKSLSVQKKREFRNYKESITCELEKEICGRYYYLPGEIKSIIRTDTDIADARLLLNNIERYKEILRRK